MFRPPLASSLCASPPEEVVGQRPSNDGVVVDHAQNSIAAVAEQVSDDIAVMTMIDNELVVKVGRTFADSADPILADDHGVVFGLGDSVLSFEAPVPAVFLLPGSGCGPKGLSILGSMGSSVFLDSRYANPPAARPVSDLDGYGFLAAPAVGSFGLDIDVHQAVVGVDLASTPPPSVPPARTVSFDGDDSAAVTNSAASCGVYVTQGVQVFAPRSGVPPLEEVRPSLDQPSGLRILGGDGGFLPTPAVTESVGDFAFGVFTSADFSHGKDCIMFVKDGAPCFAPR